MNTDTIICGDSAEVLTTLGKLDFTAVVTDPPYGIGRNNIVPGKRSSNMMTARRDYGNFKWDERRPDIIKMLAEMTVHKTFVCFGGNYYADVLPVSRGWAVWDKDTGGAGWGDFEMIWTNADRAARMFRYTWNGMIKQKPETRVHPTQKPLALMKWIIETYTQPNDIILDPFAGSGTTLVACAELGRKYIGIEISPEYCNLIERRLAAANVPLPFFAQVSP
jgi:site-specific DNA-methyltransferase (adenine-specific)